jgi:DNA-binding protein HU-beta
MTKSELVNEIAIKTGLDKIIVQETVETFFRVVKNSMAGGNNIYLRGFGTFQVKRRAAKVARNLQKNTVLSIEEHFVPKFKPSKEFMDRVRHAQVNPDED